MAQMRAIRAHDRAAQGITGTQEEQGIEACKSPRTLYGGRLTVVTLPHGRTATVTDVLDKRLGGPGYENLLIFSPEQTSFFGAGGAINALKEAFPGGWSGGELPQRGFWGHASFLGVGAVLAALAGRLKCAVHSQDVVVSAYHLILIWPVLLRGSPPGDDQPLMSRWADWMVEHGRCNDDGATWADALAGFEPDDVTPVPDEFAYEETIYFHPFVHDFLMGDGADPQKGPERTAADARRRQVRRGRALRRRAVQAAARGQAQCSST